MDSIDPIVPITAIHQTVVLRVAESNKDGRQKPGGDEEPHEKPHDVLELHNEDGEEVLIEPEEVPEPPSNGLDLAV